MSGAAFLHHTSPTMIIHHPASRHQEFAVATTSRSSLERFTRRPAAQHSWLGVGLESAIGGERQQEKKLTLALADDTPVDAVWWDEGCAVQSLEIKCMWECDVPNTSDQTVLYKYNVPIIKTIQEYYMRETNSLWAVFCCVLFRVGTCIVASKSPDINRLWNVKFLRKSLIVGSHL